MKSAFVGALLLAAISAPGVARADTAPGAMIEASGHNDAGHNDAGHNDAGRAALSLGPDAGADAHTLAPGMDAGHDLDQIPAPEDFGALFASWQQIERGAMITSTGEILGHDHAQISVPSRMPVEGVRLTSGFGMRNHPVLRQRRHHNGVDLAAPKGTPVYATANGYVAMAQYYSSYGNYVQIEHGGAMQTRYAHLSSYTVAVGDRVKKGDLIGYVGSTGRSTGPHLHYEVRFEGQPVNPMPYMLADLRLTEDAFAVGGPDEE